METSGLERILVVDDEPVTRLMIQRYLEKSGLRVLTASSGVEGLLKAFSEEVSLVFIDVNLPETKGSDIISRLRSDGFIAPIVVLSADSTAETHELCFEAGCSDYLSKPTSLAALREILDRYLSPHSGGMGAKPILSEMEDEDDDDVIKNIVEDFLNSLDGRITLLKNMIEIEDWEEATKLAHKLKGAGLFGFPELSETAGLLEQATKAQDRVLSIEQLIALASIVSRINLGRPRVG